MADKPLSYEDFKATAAWLTHEISSSYTVVSRSSFYHQPADAQFTFRYRQPLTLVEEERGVLAVFFEQVFFIFFKTGRTTGFNVKSMLQAIVRRSGHKYKLNGAWLHNIALTFVNEFPSFIQKLKDKGAL